MTDNNRKGQDADSFGEEFDFASWSVDGAGEAPKGGDTSDDDAFDADESFTEGRDDPFSEFQMGSGELASSSSQGGFGQQEDDEFFESDEFQGMPMPDAPVAGGDADDEFADVGNPSHASGFSGGHSEGEGDFVDDDPAPRATHGDDEFVDDEFIVSDSVGDEFAEDGGTEDFGTSAEPPVANTTSGGKPGLSRLIFPIAALAGVAAVGYAGYSFVLPMLFGEEAPQVAQAPAPSAAPSLPKALPGMKGGLDIPGSGVPAPKSPLQPTAVELPTSLGGLQPLPGGAGGRPAETVVPSQSQPAPSQPVQRVDVPTLSLPDLPVAAGAGTPPETAPKADPSDDLVGGDRRIGIGALKPTPAVPVKVDPPIVPASPSPPVSAVAETAAIEREIQSLRGDMGAIRREIAALTARLEEIRNGGHATVSAPAVQRPTGLPADVVPPLKPAIVDGVTLKGVSRDVAWVSTGSGVVEVKEGDTIPGAGQVVRFRAYAGDWVLVTTQGLVTR